MSLTTSLTSPSGSSNQPSMVADDADDDRRGSRGAPAARDSRRNSRIPPGREGRKDSRVRVERDSRKDSRVQVAMDALVKKRKSNLDVEVKFVDGRRE